MPNWVYNNLTIAPDSEAGGTTKDVADLVEQVGKPYTIKTRDWKSGEMTEQTVEEPFAFWNIVRPEGEDLEKYDGSLGTGGAMPFWYDWNCENWGTKWDASDVDRIDQGKDHIQYTFQTAWSPPIQVMQSLSEQHPNLHIELEWEEEQGYGGTFTFRAGVTTETDYYDIPSSHADYVARDRECGCETWADEAPFTDCPTYVAEPDPSMIISENELEVEAVR
jgi:hypothetical protein